MSSALTTRLSCIKKCQDQFRLVEGVDGDRDRDRDGHGDGDGIPELSGWIVYFCGSWGSSITSLPRRNIPEPPKGTSKNHLGKPRRSLVPADDRRVQPIGGHLEDWYPLGTEGTIDRSVLEKRHAIAVGDIDHNELEQHRFDHINDRASGRFAPNEPLGSSRRRHRQT